jgi:hypothetical protein
MECVCDGSCNIIIKTKNGDIKEIGLDNAIDLDHFDCFKIYFQNIISSDGFMEMSDHDGIIQLKYWKYLLDNFISYELLDLIIYCCDFRTVMYLFNEDDVYIRNIVKGNLKELIEYRSEFTAVIYLMMCVKNNSWVFEI